MKTKIYIVTMYRWGCNENHSYIIGAFDKYTKAEKAGIKEEQSRGGKYNASIAEVELNKDYGGISKEIKHRNSSIGRMCADCKSDDCWLKKYDISVEK